MYENEKVERAELSNMEKMSAEADEGKIYENEEKQVQSQPVGNTAETTSEPMREQASESSTRQQTSSERISDSPVWIADSRTKLGETQEGKSGFFSKIMVSVSLGLLFGIFAGIGFFAVQQGVRLTQKDEIAVESHSPKEVFEIPEVIPEGGSVAPTQTTQVVYKTAESNVTKIVEEVMPAMVSIVNSYTERYSSFWGQTYVQDVEASGSGIIVSETEAELLIVTNNHVVDGANKLYVTLIDGTEVEARLKGTDADMDLAVISISLNDLEAKTKQAIAVARLGDSDNLKLGEQVIAIGNALGYGQSVTVGYVSALDRSLDLEDGSTNTFIQTDAAINHGNSGGALLNAIGEVIGINSAKIGGSSVEGMGYAIPITAASPIIADLMERQTRTKVSAAEQGYMGISYQEVNSDISMMFGIPEGVYVASVVSDSGADLAGMMKGDVITSFDGSRITSYNDLQKVLQYYAVGDVAKVTVMRPSNGEYVKVELQVTLGERPETNALNNSNRYRE